MKVHIELAWMLCMLFLKPLDVHGTSVIQVYAARANVCFHIFGPLNSIIQTQVHDYNTQMCPNCLNFETKTQICWGDETKFNILWIIFEKIINGFVIVMS